MAKRAGYEGKVALITGGASGIGKALAEAMADRGAEVAIADRQTFEGEAVAQGIRARGGRAYAFGLDVRDADAFARVAAEVESRSGQIDYFFNNAGIGVAGEVSKYGIKEWEDVFDVNLRGVTNGIQAVYPRMIARGRGHIVNTASMAGLLPMPGGASYTATKHAVVGLTKALRIEAATHGVNVSVLCPGAIRTPILTGGKYGRNDLAGVGQETIRAMWEKLRPMDPAAFADEVLDAVAKNPPYIIVPTWWKAMWLVERIAPRLSLALSALRFAEMRKAADAEAAAPAAGTRPAAAAGAPAEARRSS